MWTFNVDRWHTHTGWWWWLGNNRANDGVMWRHWLDFYFIFLTFCGRWLKKSLDIQNGVGSSLVCFSQCNHFSPTAAVVVALFTTISPCTWDRSHLISAFIALTKQKKQLAPSPCWWGLIVSDASEHPHGSLGRAARVIRGIIINISHCSASSRFFFLHKALRGKILKGVFCFSWRYWRGLQNDSPHASWKADIFALFSLLSKDIVLLHS